MYKLPSAGPSFLIHLLVIIAALLTLPIVRLMENAKGRQA